MSTNKLKAIESGVFDNLTSVTNLDLLNNDITSIEFGSLDDLESLVTLDLRGNKLHILPYGVFDELRSLTWIYFDHFSFCGYAPSVRHCYPRGDGISSIENLLDNIVLRIMVWVMAVFAFIGNILVPIVRCIFKEDNRVHSFFIMNLSFADMLMSFYLFIIAVHDVMYRGEYINFDLLWRTSWVCQMSGFLSLVSCEASVLILTVITFDRFICIVYPFKMKERSMKMASWAMLSVWFLCIIVAILPLFQSIEYFDHLFYGGNGVCLPLRIDQVTANGWEYSFAIFVCVNFLAFVFIIFAYVKMFITIQNSRENVRSSTENQDLNLAKRFTLIVTTDLLCWMPIIAVNLLAFGGVKIDPSVYAWVAVFVLPVNSALNPFLYTMTTKLFKQKVRRIISTISTDKKTEEYFSIRSSRTRMSGSSTGSRHSVNGKLYGNIYVMKTTRTVSSVHKAKREPFGRGVSFVGQPSISRLAGHDLSKHDHHRIVCIVPTENTRNEKKV
ncbi:relaxin receptor 1-like [Ptychodera flava]|uniref:relaxin receptor 1-like n=1 Tax=Ptychodera flava TaxID=63121 RepID=UPI00396A78D0